MMVPPGPTMVPEGTSREVIADFIYKQKCINCLVLFRLLWLAIIAVLLVGITIWLLLEAEWGYAAGVGVEVQFGFKIPLEVEVTFNYESTKIWRRTCGLNWIF